MDWNFLSDTLKFLFEQAVVVAICVEILYPVDFESCLGAAFRVEFLQIESPGQILQLRTRCSDLWSWDG